MGEWKECKLGELVETNKQNINKDYSYSEIFYLDTGSITEGKIDGFQKYFFKEAPTRAKRLVEHIDFIQLYVRFTGMMVSLNTTTLYFSLALFLMYLVYLSSPQGENYQLVSYIINTILMLTPFYFNPLINYRKKFLIIVKRVSSKYYRIQLNKFN